MLSKLRVESRIYY